MGGRRGLTMRAVQETSAESVSTGPAAHSASAEEVARALFTDVATGLTEAEAQRRRAGRALQALRAMMAPTARVLRDGRVRELLALSLVPGDIVLLEVGHYVP